MIMGDMSDTLEGLLMPKGIDHSMLSSEEIEAGDMSRLLYTNHDKKVLRHFEGLSVPAHRLRLFLQDKRNAWSYLTFMLRVTVQDTLAPMTAIYADISRMDTTTDLRNRGQKTVLVERSDAVVPPAVANKYMKVETMEPCVEQYTDLYAEDLVDRIGLDDDTLPPVLSLHVLLNPLFGGRSRITGAGLLTDTQYGNARLGE